MKRTWELPPQQGQQPPVLIPTLAEIRDCIEKRLFLGRLPPSATEQELRDVFGIYGAVRDARTLGTKGVGFVSFDSWQAAQRALLGTDGQCCLRGCPPGILVSFAEKTGNQGRGKLYAKGLEFRRIYLKNLPEALSEMALRQLLARHGQVEEASVCPMVGSRGTMGVALMSLWGEALDVIEALDGQKYPDSSGEAMQIGFADEAGNPAPVNPFAGAKFARFSDPVPVPPPIGAVGAGLGMLGSFPGIAMPPPPPPMLPLPGLGPGASMPLLPLPADGLTTLPAGLSLGAFGGMLGTGPMAQGGVPVGLPAPLPVMPSVLATDPLASTSTAPATGDPEFAALKAAWLAAIDGDSSDAVCEELHNKILVSRPLAKQAATTAAALTTAGGAAAGVLDSALLAAAAAGLHPGGAGGAGLPGLDATTAAALAALGLDSSALAALGAGAAVSTSPVGLPAAEERDAARLFVGGLPAETTEAELQALISQVEFSAAIQPSMKAVLECRVLAGRGCGYVKFSSWEAAQEAIAGLNDRSVAGWKEPLRVRWATPKSVLAGASVASATASQAALLSGLGLGGLGSFGGLGALAGLGDLAGGLNPLGGLALGGTQAAFDGVQTALQALLGANPDLAVSQHKEKIGSADELAIQAQGMDPRRLFVGQLRRELQGTHAQPQLHRMFEPFGIIENLRWLEDKGVCYVQYRDFASASAAITTLNGQDIPGISSRGGLNVKFSKLR
eukprot:TRINITY_DN54177_c0_g1_i1.p1 TRINITY_DN54177_c0_g1~~TRINITY_DN54177_c0_g1_i1.p1  ORF type:complete len:730 (+),score=165.40 TRINITY_DN54177_c0_g1_i1:65-2254(+)